ncbi:MAG: TIGR03067 domain-containing protein [Proteobacteria bacterium]|nr:TIGR03067 domain-containing protein [Pseudomonadota bacterium]
MPAAPVVHDRRRHQCLCPLVAATAALLAIPLAGARQYAAVEPDVPPTAQLAGQWMVASAQRGGQGVADVDGASMTLSGNRYAFAGDVCTYQITYSGTPARMDLQCDHGPHASRTVPVLYRFAGDELTMAFQFGPGVRPQNFDSPPGSSILIVRFRRAQ